MHNRAGIVNRLVEQRPTPAEISSAVLNFFLADLAGIIQASAQPKVRAAPHHAIYNFVPVHPLLSWGCLSSHTRDRDS